jgi:hypothetical protein
MTRRLLLSCIFCVWSVTSLQAQEKPKPSYDALLDQVKKSDPKADFLQLRMAFTRTANYKPYDSDNKARKGMTDAWEKKDLARAVALAQQVLKNRYVDLTAHWILSRAYAELKKADQAKYHRRVFDGLVQSILKSGNGKGPASAYVVISTDEEYAVLGVLGVRTTGQALINHKGKRFDRIDGVKRGSGDRVTIYFNIDKQFSWLQEQFKKGK